MNKMLRFVRPLGRATSFSLARHAAPVSASRSHCPALLLSVRRFHDPSLEELDPEVFSLLQKEKDRQKRGLELIASEVAYNIILCSVLCSVVFAWLLKVSPHCRFFFFPSVLVL